MDRVYAHIAIKTNLAPADFLANPHLESLNPLTPAGIFRPSACGCAPSRESEVSREDIFARRCFACRVVLPFERAPEFSRRKSRRGRSRHCKSGVAGGPSGGAAGAFQPQC